MKDAKNGVSTQGANASQNNVNGKSADSTIKEIKTPVAPILETTEVKKQMPESIEIRMKEFENLERFVNQKRKLEMHKAAITKISISEEELDKFELDDRYGMSITIQDSKRNEYSIANPRLVKAVKDYLLSQLDSKINEFEQLIVAA